MVVALSALAATKPPATEIGGAIASCFAREGADVAVADIVIEKAQAVAGSISAQGGNAVALQVDITDAANAQTSVAQFVVAFGKLTALIDAAAAPVPELRRTDKVTALYG